MNMEKGVCPRWRWALVAVCGLVFGAQADGFLPNRVYRLGEAELSFRIALGRPGEKFQIVTPDSMKTATVEKNGAMTALVWKGHPLCGENFTVTAELTKTDAGTQYAFRYAGNEAKGLDVEEIFFPDMLVPRTDAAGVLYPRSYGCIYRPDWKKVAADRSVVGGRPFAFHFVATVEPETDGWYLDQRGEARLYATSLAAMQGSKPSTVRLQGSYKLPVTAANNRASALPYTGVIRSYRGTWYDAARIYRAWSANQPWAKACFARDPGALRKVGLWMWNRGKAEDVIAPAERFQSETGVPVALDWYWWHETPYDKGYPYFWPPREGGATFSNAVQRLKKRGIYAQVYTNGMTCDCDDPRWEDGMKADALLLRNGKMPAVMYNVFDKVRLTKMCGEAPRYHKHMRELLTTLHGCGLPSVYMDQIGCGAYGGCWNPAHKHPMGGGDVVVKGFRALFAEIKAANPGLQISTEDPSEAYLDSTDSCICLWQSGERFGLAPMPAAEMVPVFSALYHGATATFGSYAVIDGRPPWDPRWPDAERWQDEKLWDTMYPADQFALEFARGPVIGFQPCVHHFRLDLFDNPKYKADVDFVKHTAKFWSDNLDFLYDGEMLNPGTLACKKVALGLVIRGIYTKDGKARTVNQPSLASVMHNVWKAKDGRKAAVLVNWTSQPQPWKLADTEVTGEGTLAPRSWTLVMAK